MAKSAGAEVIVTGSAAWKLDKLKEIGADHVIDTSKEDFVEVARTLCGRPRMFDHSSGVDVLINYIGGDT